MKLKVKCSSCLREHLVNADDGKSKDKISRMECLNCGKTISYRVSHTKKEDDDAVEKLMKMFNMK